MKRLVLALVVAIALPAPTRAQTSITTPKQEFGSNFGDDFFLANYQQIAAYWRKLDAQSDRMVVQEIGKTAEGRPHLMAIVTSPENHRNLERYRQTSMRLGLAQGLTDEAARTMAREGKAVVWIDGGLHASEVLGAQQLGEMVYQMVSRTDPETMRILDNVIILFVHANPDGNDLLADWYMRKANPQERSTGNAPRLYQKYIGHDNNRDFFMSTQAETENISRVLYHQWLPQVLYNHHQSGPAGTVFWSPPLRDPYNYNLDPIVVLGYQALGAAMHSRLAAEGKPGATMRSGGPYDGWWNGGIRNTASFHNVIALLTEMIGNPTPQRIPLVMNRQLPSADLAYPIAPQEWHFRQSVDYSVSLNRAVLNYAAGMREELLYNIYAAGKRSIERGNTDTWTTNPKRVAQVAARFGGAGGGRGGRGGGGVSNEEAAWAELHRPELRDPRGYIIPSDQPDFPTATKFINALREVNIAVQRATAAFTVAGKSYPAGSYIVQTAQAFRPHVIDMFEPQVHPDVFPIPGGPPTPPYDNAGWTLALQMGIKFDRVLDAFTGPFEPVTDWNAKPMAGRIANANGASGYVASRKTNDAFIAMNRLMKANEEIFVLKSPLNAGTTTYTAGTWYVRSKGTTRRQLDSVAAQLGVDFTGVTSRPADAVRVRAARVGIWDQYGGSMDAGWLRWILEQYEFPFSRVFPQELDAGNLNAKYDILVFVGGGIPGAGGGGGGGGRGGGGPSPDDVPAEYRPHLGRVSVETTLPQLRTFMENGGTVVAIGSSAPNLATFLKLPVEDHLTENGQPLPQSKFYTPGSVLAARFDPATPITLGLDDLTNVFFDDSPVFRLGAGAGAAGIKRLGWFDTKAPLRSGWSWGESYLENGVVAFEAPIGKGRALFFAPEILKRAQPHGTFKLLFNSIVRSVSP
jgi:hypothetical protein